MVTICGLVVGMQPSIQKLPLSIQTVTTNLKINNEKAVSKMTTSHVKTGAETTPETS
jgi:hypothetical protein